MTTRISWQDDLLQSRDLSQQEIEGFGFLIGWFDSWRVAKQLEVNRESARRFWKELVLQKERDQWQIYQWTEALQWFLNWIELYRKAGVNMNLSVSVYAMLSLMRELDVGCLEIL